MVATSPISTVTPARFSAGNRRKEVANTVGIMAPPMKPCSTRNTIMASRLVASAQPMLMSVKPAAEITNRTRVDIRRDR